MKQAQRHLWIEMCYQLFLAVLQQRFLKQVKPCNVLITKDGIMLPRS
jgi:hypothetical protein